MSSTALGDFPKFEAKRGPGPIESRRWEQLRFRLTGRWSHRVVEERMVASYRAQAAYQLRMDEWRIEEYRRAGMIA